MQTWDTMSCDITVNSLVVIGDVVPAVLLGIELNDLVLARHDKTSVVNSFEYITEAWVVIPIYD